MPRPRPQAPDEGEGEFWDRHGSIFGFELDGPAPGSRGRLSEDAADELISDGNQETTTTTIGGRAGKDGHGLQPRSGTDTVKSPAPAAMVNAREAHFRAIKVGKLVARIQKEGKNYHLAAMFTEQEWWDLAQRAGVRKPSARTKADVIGVLREADLRRPDMVPVEDNW